MKPIHSLLVLLLVGLLAFLTSLVFPKEGIVINKKLTLNFPSAEDWLPEDSSTDSVVGIKNLENYLEVLTADSIAADTIESEESELAGKQKEFLKIAINEDGDHPLHSFFNALKSIDEYKKIRVLHFGDSQIEMDRISGYLRDQLQKKFGGKGCGFQPLFSPLPGFAIRRTNTGEWHRYTVFGKKHPELEHNKFGIGGAFQRFSPILPDSLINDSIIHEASVSYEINKKSYRLNGKYQKARIYFSGNRRPFVSEVYADEVLIQSDTLDTLKGVQLMDIYFEETPKELTFRFSGSDSPDFYGVSFESEEGVYLDNFAMRGCSGTIFRKMDRTNFSQISDSLNTALTILQYGGNAVPYMKDSAAIADYAGWFKSQIYWLKKVNPQSGYLLIGPSDMSEKIAGEYKTRKFVVEVNEALRQVAEETNCAYWDLFEVMGGENSMKLWVEADPPLAAKDYTHFSPRGARKVGELLVQSLMKEYEKWLEDEVQ